MGKRFAVILVAAFLGFGVGKLTSPSFDPVSITTQSLEGEKKVTKHYVAMIDQATNDHLIDDGKAAPCICEHPISRDNKPCEHEELWCNKEAVQECNNRFKEYVCRSRLTAPTVNRVRQ